MWNRFLAAAFATVFISAACLGQTTEFSFQGSLNDGSQPANGNYDFEFRLFSVPAGGSAIGTLQRANVAVANGTFSVLLDFGSQFPGANRFLEIAVRQAGIGGYTILAPRQALTSTPYSVKSLSAATADSSTNAINAQTATNALQLGGVAANQYVVTTDPRLTDARPPAPGSTNYLQNSASQQPSSNFNISGNGTAAGTLTANIVNANTQFDLNGSRVFGVSPGANNTFGGIAAGQANVSGSQNSFFGRAAGTGNTIGSGNSFFGAASGNSNTGGTNNTFIGNLAGIGNTTGSNNTILGANANLLTAGLSFATAIGAGATVNRSDQIVLGRNSGIDEVLIQGPLYVNNVITAGSFFGNQLAIGTATASQPLHVAGNGLITGDLTVHGTLNATFPVTGEYIQNRTDPQPNSNFSVTGDGKVAGVMSVGQQTSQTSARLRVGATGDLSPAILGENTSFGQFSGVGVEGISTNNPGFGTGGNFIGGKVGVAATSSASTYTGLSYGVHALATGTNGVKIGVFGKSSVFPGNSNGYGVWGVADGAGATKYGVYGEALGPGTNYAGYFNGDTVVAGRLSIGGLPNASAKLIVAGTSLMIDKVGIGTDLPESMLHVQGQNEILSTGTGAGFKFRDRTNSTADNDWAWYSNGNTARLWRAGLGDILYVSSNGFLGIGNQFPGERLNVNGHVALLLASGGSTNVCLNAVFRLSTCSSSIRYKSSVREFASGLELVRRLSPVRFEWKDSGTPDLGLVAEEVAEIEPLLVTYNDKGEVEGVKYDRIGVVLVNALKEQQREISEQRKQMEEQQKRIDALYRLVCELKPDAPACKDN
ncbi:MAG: tail fiber domain-containing protein [Aridibacter famidurans]|nr:tail fiber domain-containing protein [Aridibacter famidurans]